MKKRVLLNGNKKQGKSKLIKKLVIEIIKLENEIRAWEENHDNVWNMLYQERACTDAWELEAKRQEELKNTFYNASNMSVKLLEEANNRADVNGEMYNQERGRYLLTKDRLEDAQAMIKHYEGVVDELERKLEVANMPWWKRKKVLRG